MAAVANLGLRMGFMRDNQCIDGEPVVATRLLRGAIICLNC